MNETSQRTEGRIIQAAINCINQEGLDGITVRKIARMAGVNAAAINYYFRSKDRLVDLAMETTLHNAFDGWYEILADHSQPLRKRLHTMLENMIGGAIYYMGISRAHLYPALIVGDRDNRSTLAIRRLVSEIHNATLKDDPNADRQGTEAAVVQLISSALLAPIAPALFEPVTIRPLSENESRSQFIESLLNSFFYLVNK